MGVWEYGSGERATNNAQPTTKNPSGKNQREQLSK
jgi:hypothetical protein